MKGIWRMRQDGGCSLCKAAESNVGKRNCCHTLANIFTVVTVSTAMALTGCDCGKENNTTPTASPSFYPTGEIVITNEPTKVITVEPTITATPEITEEVTPEVTQEVTPEVTPTEELTPTPEITEEVTPTPEPTATPTEKPVVTVVSVTAKVKGSKYYIGDTLKMKDFEITVTLSDGTVLTNPNGCSVDNTKLTSTTNTLIASYKGVSYTFTVKAEKKPEPTKTPTNTPKPTEKPQDPTPTAKPTEQPQTPTPTEKPKDTPTPEPTPTETVVHAHVHNYNSKETITPATCEHEGLDRYTCECGDFYDKVTEKLAHNWVTNTWVEHRVHPAEYVNCYKCDCGQLFYDENGPWSLDRIHEHMDTNGCISFDNGGRYITKPEWTEDITHTYTWCPECYTIDRSKCGPNDLPDDVFNLWQSNGSKIKN